MGRRPNISSAQSEWIADQLLRAIHPTRSPEVWRALHAEFLAAFPGAEAAVPLARYKQKVATLERLQEAQPAARAAAHLRRHELLTQRDDGLRRVGREEPRGQQEEEDEEEEEEEEEEEDEDEEDEAVEMVIKSEWEAQQAKQDARPAARAPRPLLRTRVTAAEKAARDEANGDVKPTEESNVSKTTLQWPSAPQHVPVLKKRKAPGTDVQQKKEGKSSKQWQALYEAEKGKSAALETQLKEALEKLDKKDRHVQHLLQTTASATPSSAAPNTSGLSFVVSLNVDVLQNGQHVQTTAHALQVNTTTNRSDPS